MGKYLAALFFGTPFTEHNIVAFLAGPQLTLLQCLIAFFAFASHVDQR